MGERPRVSRRRFLETAGVTPLAGFGGCAAVGGTTSGRLVDHIVFYNAGKLEFDPGTRRNIERFEDETGITVEVPEVPWPDLKTSLTTIWRNRSPKVDAWNGPTWWLADFVASGWLEPLDLPDAHFSKFPANLRNLVTFDDQIYMAPQLGKWGTFLYDREYLADFGFESPPDTWDDVVSLAHTLEPGYRSAFAFPWGNKNVFSFKQFVYQAGGQLFDGNEPAFVEPGIEVFDFLGRLREAGSFPGRIATMGQPGIRQAFFAGRLASVVSWTPLGARTLRQDGWDADRLGSAKPPMGPESRATFQDTNGIGVSAFSQRTEAAKKFAAFMTTERASKLDMLVEGNPSVVPAVYDDPEIRNKYPEDLLEDMKFNLEHAQSETYLAQPQVDEYLSEQITPALLGEKDPEAALRDAEKNIRQIYETLGLL